MSKSVHTTFLNYNLILLYFHPVRYVYLFRYNLSGHVICIPACFKLYIFIVTLHQPKPRVKCLIVKCSVSRVHYHILKTPKQQTCWVGFHLVLKRNLKKKQPVYYLTNPYWTSTVALNLRLYYHQRLIQHIFTQCTMHSLHRGPMTP